MPQLEQSPKADGKAHGNGLVRWRRQNQRTTSVQSDAKGKREQNGGRAGERNGEGERGKERELFDEIG